MGVSDSGILGEREFPSTSWSVILRAKDSSSPEYARHLGRLIELYWRPVFCVIRHAYKRTRDDAKDLTQDFFASVVLDRALVRTFAPERGSFRALLRTALTNFMRDLARHDGSRKRGGGVAPIPIDELTAEALDAVPGSDQMTPEQLFDLSWNETVMSGALARLEERLTGEGRAGVLEVFRRYDLCDDGARPSYADLGGELGLSVPQVKHALLHARATFRELVTGMVRAYVDDPADLAAELHRLLGG